MSAGTQNSTTNVTVETRVGPLTFTHDLPNGYPTGETLEKLFDERDFQRACQAYLWSTPIVGFAEWQHAAKGLGAKDGQPVAYLSYVDKLGILTPNSTTPYYVAFADLAETGPLVLEFPASGIRGGLVNVWQEAMEGCQPGGKYVLIGPGQPEPANLEGRKVLQSSSINLMIGLRITVTDPAEARAVLAQLRIFPLSQRQNLEVMPAADRPWSGTPQRGLGYWKRLHDILQREPIAPRDHFFHEMLRPLGIAKGQPFAPNDRQKALLEEGALVGEAMAKANTYDRRFPGVKYRQTHWDHALNLNADDPAEYWDRLDERASWFYEAYSAAADMSPNRPGTASSTYLGAYRDQAGDWLDGGASYRLRVPANTPANLFWSLTLYDLDTRSLLRNDQQIADRSSRMDLKLNDNGSVDIYCGPTPPAGFEQNWIPTVPGKGWFAYFRLYEPTQAYFDATWPLPDFEKLSVKR